MASDPSAPAAPAADSLSAPAPDGAGDVVVRRATAADNDALRALFASVTMEADLQLAVHRDPDMFTLYDMQGGEREVWVGEVDGQLVGMGALLVRDGYLGGAPTRIGYLGDLRLLPRVRGRSVLGRLYGPVLEDFTRRHGIEVFTTAVIASNRRAIEGLTSPKAREVGIPPYHLVQKFAIRAVHLLQPRRAPRTNFRVRRAAHADIAALAAFLDEDGRARPFGYACDEAELRRRLAQWPGLDIEDFLLATGGGGEIVGCLALWDATPAKQMRAVAYNGSMRRTRTLYNAAAGAMRAARLPAPGGQLRYLYATHVAIPGRDPDVLRALLGTAYRDTRRSGNVFISICAPKGSPLEPAYRGYVTNDLPAHLYAVVPGGLELPAAAAAAVAAGGDRGEYVDAGFEMAVV